MVNLLYTNKIPLVFNINDWIEVDFYYSSQKKIIKAIGLIEQECRRKGYEIANVDGKLSSKNESEPSCINLVVKIEDVCCRFNFYFENNCRSHELKKYMSKVVKFKFGASIFGLMETSKKHSDSLAAYLRRTVQELKKEPAD